MEATKKLVRLLVVAVLVADMAGANFVISRNVCNIDMNGNLDCFMKTLQADISDADFGAVSEAQRLSVQCSDAFFYESQLKRDHFGSLPDLEHLQVDYCKIRAMPAQAFIGIDGLKSLAIRSHNSEWSSVLMDVNADTFAKLNLLESLDLSNNNIWSLPAGALCNLSRMVSLNVSKNHLLDITDLGLHHSEGCQLNLEHVDISGNYISSLRKNDLHQVAESLIALNLSSNRLSFLADDALSELKNLEVLDMSSNQLAALPPAIFKTHTSVKELHLQNNSLTTFVPGLFSDLSQLVLLNLSRNAISNNLAGTSADVEDNNNYVFGGLVDLKILDLSYNRITKLETGIFQPLTSLTELILDGNRIHSIVPENRPFSLLPLLTKLHLAHNKLTKLTVENLKNLSSLALNNNDLREITFDNQVATSLRELQLSSNQLKAVPQSLFEVSESALTILDLNDNRIESIEDGSLSALSSLEILGLGTNELASLTNGTFGNLTSLAVLDLSNNRLESIPQGAFKGLSNGLVGLRLDGNNLVDLNGVVASLGNLQWLNVSSNRLEWFDYAFIPSSLSWLDISHNEIAELGNFYSLDNFGLRNLEAGYNRIEKLDGALSLPSTRLHHIQLQHNDISDLPPHFLAHLEGLKSLDLRNNRIRSFPKESLRKSIHHEGGHSAEPRVLLGGNPLVCDCHLEWLPSINDDFAHIYDTDADATGSGNTHASVGDLSELECQWQATPGNDPEGGDDEALYVLVSQVPRDKFLCSYTTHCFDLCRCCDFYACDCRMQCPSGCSCQHDSKWSQNVITCSNGNQTKMPLLIPMDSTSVHLDGNNYGHIGQQHFLGRQRVETLYLNNSGVTSLADNALVGLSGLRSLWLDSNPLQLLRGQEFTGLYNLRELYLQDCALTSISEVAFEPLRSLEVLRLDGNLITSFPVWRLASNAALASLTLSANLWSCECEFVAPFNAFLETNIALVKDYESVQCVADSAVAFSRDLCKSEAKSVPKKHVIASDDSQSSYDLAAILVPSLMSISVIVVGFLAIFVFRKQIKTWLYNKSSKEYESRYNSSVGTASGLETSTTIQSGETTKLFDLYVSYAQSDSDFVDHSLAPTLEHSPHTTYRLCLHHRDAPKSLPDASYDMSVASFAAESSTKILVVMSKEYLATEWPIVKAGILDNVSKSPAGKLVVLTIDDLNEANIIAEAPELLAVFKSGPVVKWGSPGFINKLRFYLPESVHATFQRNVTLRSIHNRSSCYGVSTNVLPTGIGYHQQQIQSEPVYHYIPDNHVYHTLEPLQLMTNLKRTPNTYGPSHGKTASNPTSSRPAAAPGVVLKLNSQAHGSFENPAMVPPVLNTISQNLVCHSHSLSASSGTRLLTSPEEYIV